MLTRDDVTKTLNDVLDHFQHQKIGPGEDWAFDDDFQTYALDYRSNDGAKFWIDLARDGTVTLLWKAPGSSTPVVLKFEATI